MELIVDTSVWSLFLRREKPDPESALLRQLRNHLLKNDCIHLIGPILQELLDGVKNQSQFELLVKYLEPFPLIELNRQDFISAAKLRNYCRSHGIQAGIIDFQIASACIDRNLPLLTADKDFNNIALHSKLILLKC